MWQSGACNSASRCERKALYITALANFPSKVLQISSNLDFLSALSQAPWDFPLCGDEDKCCGQAGRGGKGLSKLHESCSGATQPLHLLAATVVPSGPTARLSGGGIGDERGTIPLGQAVRSLSHASLNKNDGCAARLEEMGWKWLHLTYLRQTCWAESKLQDPYLEVFHGHHLPSSQAKNHKHYNKEIYLSTEDYSFLKDCCHKPHSG